MGHVSNSIVRSSLANKIARRDVRHRGKFEITERARSFSFSPSEYFISMAKSTRKQNLFEANEPDKDNGQVNIFIF